MHPTFAYIARGTLSLSAVALLLVLSACGAEDEDGTTGEAAPVSTAEQAAAPSPTPGASATRLEIEIGGGPFAGTHRVTDNVSCTAEPGTWMVASSNPGSQGPTQVLLLLEGVPVTGGSSRELSFVAHFGDPMDDTGTDSGSVTLDPAGGEGSGNGTVRRDGRGAVIEVDGATSDGAKVSAVVRCENVAGV